MNARTYTRTTVDVSIFDALFTPCTDEMQAKRAYRAASLKLHPDVYKASDAHEMFLALGEAYAMHVQRLKDRVSYERTRAEIDAELAAARAREAKAEADRQQREHERQMAQAAAVMEAAKFSLNARRMKSKIAKAAQRAAREIEASCGWYFAPMAFDTDGDIVCEVTRPGGVDEWRAFLNGQWVVCEEPKF